MPTEKTIIKLTDENWGRGVTGGCLYNSGDGRMCITGHILLARGIDPKGLLDPHLPHPESDLNVDLALSEIPVAKLFDINDDDHYKDDERVGMFNDILGPHDLEVVFG